MSLEQVIQTMESRIWELGQQLLTDPATRLREEAEHLRVELHSAYATLGSHRRRCTEARRRIAAGEVRATLLASQVETAWQTDDRDIAWEQALELEEVRRQLTAGRAALPYLERACRTEQRRVEHLERSLAPLQEKLSLR
jgi:hypothetical protein